MRELRKETEITNFCNFIISLNLNIRNERTPKGDGNLIFLVPLSPTF